jgi:hypothetical protein
MTEEKQAQPSASEVWQEVGQQFRVLGESLAAAFKATWESKETRQHLEKMQAGLEEMVDEISQATKKVADTVSAGGWSGGNRRSAPPSSDCFPKNQNRIRSDHCSHGAGRCGL